MKRRKNAGGKSSCQQAKKNQPKQLKNSRIKNSSSALSQAGFLLNDPQKNLKTNQFNRDKEVTNFNEDNQNKLATKQISLANFLEYFPKFSYKNNYQIIF